MKTFAVVISSLLLAAPALSQASGADTNSSSGDRTERESRAESNDSARPAATEERRVCRRLAGATGTRTDNPRVCMTAEQWRAHDRRGY